MRKSQSDPTRFKPGIGGIAKRNIAARALHQEMFGTYRPKKSKKPKAVIGSGFSCICPKDCLCKFCSVEIQSGQWMYRRPKLGRVPEVSACYTCGERVFRS